MGVRAAVIRIHRDHAFELVASAMQPYLAYAGWDGDFRYGEYDDSLSFGGVPLPMIARWTKLAESLRRLASVRQSRFRAGPGQIPRISRRGVFMKLLVVVLCYRVPDLTIDCLRSLSREIGRVPDAKVALCENGTGGDTADRLSLSIEKNDGARGSTSRSSIRTWDLPGAITW